MAMDTAKLSVEDRRVRWHCRRGMKELDVMLERYFDNVYASAGETERAAFRLLLEQDDPTLWHWLSGALPVGNPRLEVVVGRLRGRC